MFQHFCVRLTYTSASVGAIVFGLALSSCGSGSTKGVPQTVSELSGVQSKPQSSPSPTSDGSINDLGDSPSSSAKLLLSGFGTCLSHDAKAPRHQAVVSSDCSGGEQQMWKFNDNGTLAAVGTDLCLSAGSLHLAGAQVFLGPCDSMEGQSFSLSLDKTLRTSDGFCLAIKGSPDEENQITLQNCQGVRRQFWSHREAPTTECKITIKECPAHPSVVGVFKEEKKEISSLRSRCLLRARQYTNYCQSTKKIDAEFQLDGVTVGKVTSKMALTSAPAPSPAITPPPPVYDCTESGIRAAAAANSVTLQCLNQEIQISSTISVTGSGFTLDGGGSLKLKWIGPGQCDQSETQSAIIDIKGSGNILKGFEVVNAPDGIHVSQGDQNTLDHLIFNRVCEDAITQGESTAYAATNTVIKGCKFSNAEDKAIQVNGGSVFILDNQFKSVGKALATGNGSSSTSVRKTITFERNTIEDCRVSGVRVSGQSNGKSVMQAKDNRLKNCKRGWVVEDEGEITSISNRFQGSCKFAFSASDHGKIRSSRDQSDCEEMAETDGHGDVDF